MQQVFSSLIGPSGPYYADLNGRTAIITGGATGIVSPTCRLLRCLPSVIVQDLQVS
jgi:hypothetical protein